MRVVHVVPAIAEESSGPSYSVPMLCEALIRQGDEVTLTALDWSGSRALPYLTTFPASIWLPRLGASRALHHWLRRQAGNGDLQIIHNHGMWQMNALYPGWVCRNSSCLLVVSPRGAFSRWAMAHGSRAKQLFWKTMQRPALTAASCFHATSEAEYQDIRRLGFKQPVAVIPNGIDVLAPTTRHVAASRARTLLFLGRIHKTKGLDLLLPAWASLQQEFPDWRLRIVGSDGAYGGGSGRGYLARMQALAAGLGAQRVEFAGELTGEDKWDAYRQADLFVLPTYSENFGIAVAEALASEVPAIVTRGAPWSELDARRAGWWIDATQQAIAATLHEAMSRPQAELQAMGLRGRQWMLDEFGWSSIGQRMSSTYRWLTGKRATTPDWVRND